MPQPAVSRGMEARAARLCAQSKHVHHTHIADVSVTVNIPRGTAVSTRRLQHTKTNRGARSSSWGHLSRESLGRAKRLRPMGAGRKPRPTLDTTKWMSHTQPRIPRTIRPTQLKQSATLSATQAGDHTCSRHNAHTMHPQHSHATSTPRCQGINFLFPCASVCTTCAAFGVVDASVVAHCLIHTAQ